MPVPAGPVINAASSLLSPVFNEINAGRRQKREQQNVKYQREQNQMLAQYAYDQDLAQWERQNQYNTPAQQMARFKEAGLNPNLIYGQGTPGNAPSSPKYQTVREEKAEAITAQHNPLDTLSQYQQIRQSNAQTDLTQQSANVERGKAIQMEWLNRQTTQTAPTGKAGEFRTTKSSRFKDTYLSEYSRTQAQTSQAHSDAILKKLEAELYKKMGIGGGAIGQLLKALFMFKR